MSAKLSTDGHVLVQGPRGRIFTTLLDRSAVYFYFEGHVDFDMFAPTMGPATEALTTGRAVLYGDGARWETYGAGYRDAWTKWFTTHRARIAHTYLLVRSPILKMGVQVVNMFTGGSITALSAPEELYGTLRRDVPGVVSLARTWPPDIAQRAGR